MEPRTLPGFFWDPLKKKYFKIQPNHIAPDSRYSAGAIEDSKLELQTLQEEEKKRIKARRQLLKHDYRIHDPRTTLQYQLGGHGPGSTTSVVAEYYGASISSRRVLQEASIPQFALDPKSGILFTATWDNGHPESSVTNLVSLGQDADDQGNWTWRTPGRRMNRLPSRIASLMVTNGVLAWVEEPDATGYVHLQVVNLDQDTYRITNHVRFSLQDEQRLQLTASPGGTHWLGWTSCKILLRPVLHAQLHPPVVLKSFDKKEDSLLTVAFKDESVLMAGHRSGFVNFLDHRKGTESQVRRMRHDSPFNALRSLKDGHTILASGMTSTALYDLRYLAAPRTSKKSEPRSTAVLKFATPQTSDRLELGVDYLADLNLVAIASSRRGEHKVTLYSTRTGRRIASALDRESFMGPVPCLKFHETPDGQFRLLMAAASEEEPTLIEWGCEFDQA